MWVTTIDGELALVGWSRDSKSAQPFFFPLSHSAELIWQVNTLPEHRGKGAFTQTLLRMQEFLFEEGRQDLFITCADHNRPSMRAIGNAGFKRIGRGRIRLQPRKLVWIPDL
jgi:RimJ/RimL family protein N-acetyltransferase